MFKKTLLALAVASTALATIDASAATVTAVNIDFSAQGSASNSNIDTNAITVLLAAEYAMGDLITFTFSGGTIVASTFSTTVQVTGLAAGPAPGLIDDDKMTLGLLNTTANSATYRVTELNTLNGGTTVGGSINLGVVTMNTASVVANGPARVTYGATLSDGTTVLDNLPGSVNTGVILTAINQFSVDRAGATLYDAVIDVENDRLTFDIGSGSTTIDLADFTMLNDGSLALPATSVTFKIELMGDFAYLDTNLSTPGVQTTAFSPGAVSVTNSVATFTGLPSGTSTIAINTSVKPAGSVIPVQSFTADIMANYTTDGGAGSDSPPGGALASAMVANNVNAGQWILNGSLVHVPYVPFGPITQPVLRHTNIGSQTGDITGRYMVEGVHTTWQNLGTLVMSAAPGVHNLLSPVTSALAGAGFDASVSGFKVALEITTNVPAKDVTVFAAAKITTTDSDRISIGAFNTETEGR